MDTRSRDTARRLVVDVLFDLVVFGSPSTSEHALAELSKRDYALALKADVERSFEQDRRRTMYEIRARMISTPLPTESILYTAVC